LLAGAAAAHTFGLAAGPNGVPQMGAAAVVVSLILLLSVSMVVYFKAVSEERRRAHVGG